MIIRKNTLITAILIRLIWIISAFASEQDLPLSDRIQILKVTPYGPETKGIFENKLEVITYETMKESVLQKINAGYKPDCDCDFDNSFFLQLGNRPIIYGNERDNPPVIGFPGTFKKDGDSLTFVTFQCQIILSKNKKYAGLIFKQIINDQLFHQHFMLVNSKGEMLWEEPHKTKETIADNTQKRINFPEDEKSNTYDYCQVSNDGKFVFLRGSFLRGEKGWVLYGSEGKVIKKNSTYSLYPVLSDNGEFLLVQENNKADSTDFYDDSGTSCYDANNGTLLWRRKNILPIHGSGYFISPSGEKIIACLKNNMFSPCIINNKGKTMAISADSEKKRCSTEDFYPGWNLMETSFFWHKSVFDSEFKFSSHDSFLPTKYKNCSVYHTYYLSEMYFLGFGSCFIDMEYKLPAKETRKFICIRDYEMNVLGFEFIDTPGLGDLNMRIEIDRKCGKILLRTNDVLISAKIDIRGATK